MKIHLVGPGGAGKSTVGVLLSDRLNTPFVDLDACFRECAGDISDWTTLQAPEAIVAEIVNVLQRSATQRSSLGMRGAASVRSTNR
jgi:adenylate kinase family enzyme